MTAPPRRGADRRRRPARGARSALVTTPRARARAPELATTSAELLRRIIDLVPAFIFAKAEDGRFLLVNESVAQAYGTSVANLEGRTDADFARSEEEVRHFRADDLEVIQRGLPKRIEEHITDAQGNMRVLETVKIPFQWPTTRRPAVLGVSVDVTERQRAQAELKRLNDELQQRVGQRTSELLSSHAQVEGLLVERRRVEGELRASELRQDALVEGLPDAIFLFDRARRVLEAHIPPDFETALLPAAMLGHHLSQVLPADVYGVLLQHLMLVERHGTAQLCEYSIDLASGTRQREARLVPCGEERVLMVVRDITERQAADRLKSAFMATVSHELRTPLTAVRGALGLLRGGLSGDLPDEATTMVEVAWRNTERLLTLINDIVDAERLASAEVVLQTERIELSALLDESVRINQAYADQFRVRLTRQACAGELHVQGDRRRLMQVLTNLISNAAKFSPAGGEVALSAARVGPWVRVAVHDDGPGIPAEFRPRLFQRFAQADTTDARGRGGSGLGLSIAKAIVERHRGRLDFESASGAGTTFFFEMRAS